MPEIKSTCCYCGVGCGVVIETDGTRVIGVRGDPDHPANFGRLCTKGSTLHLTTGAENRVLQPELRTSRGAARAPVSWDQALDFAADRFASIIREHGPDAVAFYVSGQLLTEDYYVFNKLAKGLVGTNNIDTNSRLCMSSAVAGYKATLGADAPPACYEDIDDTDCIFITGSNTAYAHPILYRRIEDAKAKNPQLKIIVADPRRTDTAAAADLHLALKPGTDVALYNAMLHVMIREGWHDAEFISAHTDGYHELAATAADYSPETMQTICGVSSGDIVAAARLFAQSPRTLSLYCQGLNQSTQGTANNAALINLHLATGHIGKPGCGPFSLTGQPNAMGGREVGGLANLLSAHRDLANPAHRAEVAKLWGVSQVPAKPGHTAVEMFDAIGRGEIKAVWIVCTNPAQSMPDVERVRAALSRAQLVVVQEAFSNTDTVAYADLLLPATTWSEKEGTVTNSERRITHVRPAVAAPGQARDDWAIAAEFARRLGALLSGERDAARLFPYANAEEVFNEHRESTRGRDLDITGLSYALLDTQGPQHWPMPEGAASGKARLYQDHVFATSSGRAHFANTRLAQETEICDADYPLLLNTGRLRDQWHGMSRTGRVPRLNNHAAEPRLQMHADDMRALALRDGDAAEVASVRATIKIRVEASHELLPGQSFLPMHWGSQNMAGPGINALTSPTFDPVSKQPGLKLAAISVKKLDATHETAVIRRCDSGAQAAALMQNAQPLLDEIGCASLTLGGREAPLVILRASSDALLSADMHARIDAALGLDDDRHSLTYRDARRQIEKRVIVENATVAGVRLSGECSTFAALREAMANATPADTDAIKRLVLVPGGGSKTAAPSRGRVVCNCCDVAEMEIVSALRDGIPMIKIQETLGCGTVCGSCVPELKRLIAANPAAASTPLQRTANGG